MVKTQTTHQVSFIKKPELMKSSVISKCERIKLRMNFMRMCISCMQFAMSPASYEYSAICAFVNSHTLTITSQNNTYILCSGIARILKLSSIFA